MPNPRQFANRSKHITPVNRCGTREPVAPPWNPWFSAAPHESRQWTSPLGASNARPMDRHEFSVRDILSGEAPKETPVRVKGWVRTRRDSKAGFSFVHVSDGSSFHPVQVVAPNTLGNYTDEVLKLTAGCAV